MDWSFIFRNSAQAAVGVEACYFALAAIGLNVQFGYTGLLNFGQVAFAAAGAYGIAVAVTTYGLSFWAGLAFGIFAAIVLALVLGVPTLRLRADYLAITTIAAGEIVRLIANSEYFRPTFGGADGLQNFSDRFYELNPYSAGQHGFWIFKFDARVFWTLTVGWSLVALSCLLVFLLMRSPWGRVVKAIREDEDAVRSLGKNVYWYKMQSLMLGGVFGAFAGMVFATANQSVVPNNYGTLFTFTAYVALILGGPARVFSPVVGAIIFQGVLQFTDNVLRQAENTYGLPEWLIDSTKIGVVRFILVGSTLVLLMVFRPQGIFGDKREVAIRDR
ncbi:MAG: branched-chain amino acid transport system permease protein [Acidimicrobiaceae bacterium]|jgi:branched-chain amino acid transport system permease protein